MQSSVSVDSYALQILCVLCQRNDRLNLANGAPSWSSTRDVMTVRNNPQRWNELPVRTSNERHSSLEGYRGWPKQHLGPQPHGRMYCEPLRSSCQIANGRHTPRSAHMEQSHGQVSVLGVWQHPGSYCNRNFQNRTVYPEPQNMVAHPYRDRPFQQRLNYYGVADSEFGRTNGDRQFSSLQRRAPQGRIGSRGRGRPCHEWGGRGGWRERYVYHRTEGPHRQVHNGASETAIRKRLALGQQGTKRDWCEAESSDSPQQDHTKMRPESSDRGQDYIGGSGEVTHKLHVLEQGGAKTDGCEAEVPSLPSKSTPESAGQPNCTVWDGSSGAFSHELPVSEQGGVEIDLCEAETSDIPCQTLDGSSEASHELHIPEQVRMETDLCEVGPSDAAYQFQNSSSGTAASYRPIVPEGGVEINLHAAEASDTPSQARGGSSEGSLEQPITEQRGIGTDFCEVRPSDTPYQVQDGSSGTASQLPIPEQRGSEADLCEAEALPEHQEGRRTTEK